MKLTFFIILVTCMNVSGKVFSQDRISLDAENISIEKVFRAIEKQTEYHFVYSSTFVPVSKNVTIKVKNTLVTDVLKQILENTNLSFSIMPNNLVIISALRNSQTDIAITGLVTDSTGVPLPGVTVTIKGTRKGTATDAQGRFTITASDNATLVFSLVGYVSTESVVGSVAEINIILRVANVKMEEVVVVAYGITTKRNINSAVSTVNMDQVSQLPVQSINDAVAGRIPGIIVTASSGAPGAKSSISIRGGGTPLFVIDNILRTANDFSNLNPNDIESYSVLKDAAATALYGAIGGNGVILVTTKKGKAGRMNINYSFNQILSQPTLYPEKVSSYVQLNEINKVYINEGKQPLTPPADLEMYRTQADPIKYPNTDWQKIGFRNFANEQRHDISLSSGSNLLTYFGSLSYYNQGSNLRTDKNSNDRVTYRLNTVSAFENINLKVTTSLDGFIEKNVVPAVGYGAIFGHIQDKKANQLAYNEFGLPSNNTVDNPAVELDPKSGYSKSARRVFNGILGLEYDAHFLEGLKFKVNGNYNMWNSIDKTWGLIAPSYANNSTSPIFGNPPTLSAGTGEGTTLLLQGFVSYYKKFGGHTVDFTGGYEQAESNNSGLNGSRVQYQLLFDQFVAGPTINQTISGAEAESARAGFIGRLSYNYNSRYFIDGTVRHDGNDLFPKNKQFGTFYAISGGYVISEEKFMSGLREKHLLDYVKFRGSYGLTGTTLGLDGSNLARFQYISGYGINANAWVIDGNALQGTSEPGTLPSTNFSWYSIRSRNIGLDMASFNSRLSASVDYFYLRTTGFVASDTRYSQPLGIGLPPINFNEGATRREGTDFNVTWNDKAGAFNYKIGFNFTYFNELIERSPTEDDAALKNPNTRMSGADGGVLPIGYINAGFYNSNSDLLSGPRRISSINVAAGDMRYQDLNGDGQLDASDQMRMGKNSFPRMNYGFTFDVGYKGLFFSAVVQGSGNRDRYIGASVQNQNAQARFFYEFQQDYWRPDNTSAMFPRSVTDPGVNGNNNAVSSDFWLIQSKYIRLKYLQLGYDFKYRVIKKSAFQQLRAFISGTNLLTSSKSTKFFIDPESDINNYNYPIQRTVALGLSAGF